MNETFCRYDHDAMYEGEDYLFKTTGRPAMQLRYSLKTLEMTGRYYIMHGIIYLSG